VTPLKDATGGVTHYVGVERDITDELRLREQLVQSERLSAIGELVAGVAHEISNPLQTIVGSVELMIEQDPQGLDRQDLEIVRREAGRAGQIVRNLLSFVRRTTTDRTNADVNDIVRNTVELRRYHLRQRNISVDLALAPGGQRARGNRNEIQQIVLNLLLNAEQAILSAGTRDVLPSGRMRPRGSGSWRSKTADRASVPSSADASSSRSSPPRRSGRARGWVCRSRMESPRRTAARWSSCDPRVARASGSRYRRPKSPPPSDSPRLQDLDKRFSTSRAVAASGLFGASVTKRSR
jgi:hypothetical protein